jgi:lipopolysaccharide/colanic/teichoic acid biosynthesis glycosyltransferase
MTAKRFFDLFFALAGTALLLPAFALIAIWIKLDSPGPVFFRQSRVGRCGRPFWIFKFRTMGHNAEGKGLQITVGNDPRITRPGRFLRRYKLDELPQLLNVITGDMSLVGPRPEVQRYVSIYPDDVRELVLSVPPGITDYASIEFKDENDILAQAKEPEQVYIHEVMPVKLAYYVQYVLKRSLWIDFKLIMITLKTVVARRPAENGTQGAAHDATGVISTLFLACRTAATSRTLTRRSDTDRFSTAPPTLFASRHAIEAHSYSTIQDYRLRSGTRARILL